MDKSKETLRIGFVVEPYEEKDSSGMGYSVLETAKALARNQGSYELTLYSSKPLQQQLLPGTYRNVIIPKSFFGQFMYFVRMKKEVDVLFYVVALLPFWVPKQIKTVLICKELTNQIIKPDNVPEAIKIFIRDRLLMPRCIRRAVLILASSNATREDIVQHYGIPKEKIELVYEGFQDWKRYAADAPAVPDGLEPFFLFAGKVKPRKNVRGIVEAFILFKERTHSAAKLAIVGSYGGEYYQAMAKRLAEHNLSDEVFFLGYVSAPMMYSLYTNAIALVFPSLSEGFGMPLIESMSLGLPVISSNIRPLAEVVENAGMLVDPNDFELLSQKMEEIEVNNALREEYIQKGHVRARDFSWEKVGAKYKEVVERLQRHEI